MKKIAMKQMVTSSYIQYGILNPGKEFKENFPKIKPFNILADNKRFRVRMDNQNRIAFNKWANWHKVKPGDIIILYELIPKQEYRLEHMPKVSGCSTTPSAAERDERYNEYDAEQDEIVKTVKEEVESVGVEGWNKYKGSITTQIMIEHIKPYLPNNLTIVGHDYFIHKYPTEWDAMIVKKDAKPRFNAYEPDDVKAVIEIKESGFRGSGVSSLESSFRNIKSKFPKIKFLLILARCANKKHVISFQHAYILSGYSWRVKNYYGRWKDLVEFVKKI